MSIWTAEQQRDEWKAQYEVTKRLLDETLEEVMYWRQGGNDVYIRRELAKLKLTHNRLVKALQSLANSSQTPKLFSSKIYSILT